MWRLLGGCCGAGEGRGRDEGCAAGVRGGGRGCLREVSEQRGAARLGLGLRSQPRLVGVLRLELGVGGELAEGDLEHRARQLQVERAELRAELAAEHEHAGELLRRRQRSGRLARPHRHDQHGRAAEELGLVLAREGRVQRRVLLHRRDARPRRPANHTFGERHALRQAGQAALRRVVVTHRELQPAAAALLVGLQHQEVRVVRRGKHLHHRLHRQPQCVGCAERQCV